MDDYDDATVVRYVAICQDEGLIDALLISQTLETYSGPEKWLYAELTNKGKMFIKEYLESENNDDQTKN